MLLYLARKLFKPTTFSSKVQASQALKEPFFKCSLIGSMTAMSHYKFPFVSNTNSKVFPMVESKVIESETLNNFSKEHWSSLLTLGISVMTSPMRYWMNF